LWGLVDNYCITKTLDYLIGQFKAEILVGEFAAPVKDSDLYLVASLQKGGNLAEFDVKIVLADLEAKAHLLHVEAFRIAFVLLQLLSTLVVKLTPVDNFGHRWFGIWRNFDQIQTLLTSKIEGFLFGEYPELLAFGIDDSELRCLNGSIQASRFGDKSVSLLLFFVTDAF
jgi:hypothetical protein